MNLALKTIACLFLAAAIGGCGGGSSSSTSSTSSGSGSSSAATLSGTAATGAALANASVAITNSSGNSPCQETSITTSALGAYTCTLKTGEVAPFFIVVTDPTGNTTPLVSVATTTPAAGAALTVNATPLTTAILAQLSSDGSALTLVNSRSIDATQLTSLTAKVVAQLSSVLTAIGAPSNYDPFATAITAATSSSSGNTADMVLDVVKVTTTSTGALALSTADSTTPVAMATTTTSGSTVTAPSYSVSELSQVTQLTAQTFQACFALSTAQRALTTDTTIAASAGGSSVTSMATTCQNLFATSGGAAGIDFLHNGYSAGQSLYKLLTSDSMTNAKFSVSEIMAYYPAAGSVTYDQAVLNTRYIDGSGNAGNYITVARNITGSSTTAHPSTWWLVGNQSPVDVKVKLQVRRVQQYKSSVTTGNNISTFQTGIQFNINATGPGSVSGSDTLSFARITGPGLPSAGLVFISPDNGAPSGLNTMDMYNKTGSLSSGTRCGNSNGTTYNCPNLWIARTLGITGTDATTLGTNQTSMTWAQSADNIDGTLMVKGAQYTVELFYGSATTAAVTLHKTLLTDLVQATNAVNLPWNSPGTQTLAALDPTNSLAAQQSSLTVDWIQNIAAQQIGSIQNVIDSNGTYGTSFSIASGATSGVLANNVPAFTSSSGNRVFQFSYRMLDDTGKTTQYRYN